MNSYYLCKTLPCYQKFHDIDGKIFPQIPNQIVCTYKYIILNFIYRGAENI